MVWTLQTCIAEFCKWVPINLEESNWSEQQAFDSFAVRLGHLCMFCLEIPWLGWSVSKLATFGNTTGLFHEVDLYH